MSAAARSPSAPAGYCETLLCETLTGLVQASARRAAWVLGVVAVLTAALVYYTASHLTLDTDSKHLLDPNLPFLQVARELDRAFPETSDSIVIVVDAESADRADEAARKLITRLQQETQLIQSVYAPGENDFFASNGLLYLDKSELAQLGDRLAEAAPFLGTLSQDPSLRGLFTVLTRALDEKLGPEDEARLQKMFDAITKTTEAQIAGREQRLSWREELLAGMQTVGNDRRRFILVQPRFDYTSLHPAHEALNAVRRVAVTEQEGHPGVRVRLTGEVPIEQEELESVAKGAGVATFLSFSLVCVLLAVGFRSLRLVVATLVTLLVGLAWTAAFTTFAIGYLNLISVAFAVLFIGLGVDFGIQFAMRYREEFHHVKSHAEALARTAAGIGGALTLAATATALGFFSFIPTSYKGLAELGIISGVSMFLALLANLTVLPALLTLLPIRPRPRRREGRVLARLQALVQRRRRLILYAAALAGVAGAVAAPQARFDFNPLNMKDPTTESVATFLELLRDPQATPYTIEVLAENLDAAKALAARLGKLEVVDKAVSLASFVPEDQEEKLNIIGDMSLVLQPLVMPAGNGTPPDPAEELRAYNKFRDQLVKSSAAQPDRNYAESISRLAHALERLQAAPGWPDSTLEALRQRIVSDLPDHLARLRRLLKPSRLGLAELPPDLTKRYLAPDGRARIQVFPKQDVSDNQALRRFVKEVRAVAPKASGAPVGLIDGGDAVIQACLEAAALALFAALVLMLAVLRSVIDALLVLLPMLLAALLTTATSVLFDLPFNLANIIALPLLLAISIAFGIYLVMRRRSGMDVKHLFHTSTPRAVLFSALTTVVVFGSMAFSDHRGMSGMGLLLMLSLSFALLCTLIVLPAIMAERERKQYSAV